MAVTICIINKLRDKKMSKRRFSLNTSSLFFTVNHSH